MCIDERNDVTPVIEATTVERTCRVCGCTDNDACYHDDHGNCFWVAKDLCSHCRDYPGEATRWSKLDAAAVNEQS